MTMYRGEVGEYRVDPYFFKRAIDFRLNLLKLRPDREVGKEIIDEVLRQWTRETAHIQAEYLSAPVLGSTALINGLALGQVDSAGSYERLRARIFQGNPPEAADVLGRKIIKDQEVFTDPGLSLSEKLITHTNAIAERAASLRNTTLAAIERGETEALGYRLLGMAAFWGAAADPYLRITLQNQIRDEFVR